MTTEYDSDTFTIRVDDEVLKLAENEAIAAAPKELGGILVGWWEGEHTAVVRALLPVPDEQAGHSHYERHWSNSQRLLEDYIQQGSDARIGYIGEWHSHPAPQPPSWIDRSELKSITRQHQRPVALVIVSLTPTGDLTEYGLIGSPRWPRRVSITSARIKRAP